MVIVMKFKKLISKKGYIFTYEALIVAFLFLGILYVGNMAYTHNLLTFIEEKQNIQGAQKAHLETDVMFRKAELSGSGFSDDYATFLEDVGNRYWGTDKMGGTFSPYENVSDSGGFVSDYNESDYGDSLPYWIEPVNGNYKVWVEVSNIPANGDVEMIIKKVPGYSPNGDAVFEFFDDFNDFNKWEIVRGTTNEIYIDNGHLVMDGNGQTFGGDTVRTNTELNLPNKCVIQGRVIADDWDEWVGYFLSATNDVNIGNNHGFDDGYDFGWWGWNGNDHSMRTWRDGNQINSDHGVYSGYFDAQNGIYYYIGGMYDGRTLYHFKPTTDGSIEIDHQRDDTTYSGVNWKRIMLMVWDRAKWRYDYVFVRKYASQEPEITKVEQIQDGYRFYIHNPNNRDLNDFQIGIPASGTVDGTNYDLNIADKDESLNIITYDEIERKPIPTIYINSNQTATATLTINGAPIVLSVNGTSKTLDVETTNLIETYGANEIKLLNTNPKSSVHLSVKYNYNTPIYVAKLRPINISAYTDYN